MTRGTACFLHDTWNSFTLFRTVLCHVHVVQPQSAPWLPYVGSSWTTAACWHQSLQPAKARATPRSGFFQPRSEFRLRHFAEKPITGQRRRSGSDAVLAARSQSVFSSFTRAAVNPGVAQDCSLNPGVATGLPEKPITGPAPKVRQRCCSIADRVFFFTTYTPCRQSCCGNRTASPNPAVATGLLPQSCCGNNPAVATDCFTHSCAGKTLTTKGRRLAKSASPAPCEQVVAPSRSVRRVSADALVRQGAARSRLQTPHAAQCQWPRSPTFPRSCCAAGRTRRGLAPGSLSTLRPTRRSKSTPRTSRPGRRAKPLQLFKTEEGRVPSSRSM